MNKITTVKEARQAGFKVRVGHFRIPVFFPMPSERQIEKRDLYFLDNRDLWQYCSMSPRGGKTIVEISKDDKHSFGVAYCQLVDNYCKKEGVCRALDRALGVWSTF